MIDIGKRLKNIREHFNMKQEELAKHLGISRSSVSQIENNERKISADELMKLAKIFNISIDYLLDLEKPPEVILEEGPLKEKKRKQDIRINVPVENLKKFREVLLYILNKIGSKPNIGETVLYKILYFIDFDYYEKYEEQLIGARYQKNHYGPTPVEFKKITEKMIESGDLEQSTRTYHGYPQKRYYPTREANLSIINGNEKETIDNVLSKLSDMNAKQISEYSHNDVPWITTDDGDIIEYESVFYRTDLYSVREYPDANNDKQKEEIF